MSMNLDEKITKALSDESAQLDKMMLQDTGLFGMAGSILKGSMRLWVFLVNVFVMIMTGLFIWCFYEFWITPDTHERVFWGVCFIAALQAQIALKMWLFMEMGRNSTIREIKRVEIELARLSQLKS